MFPRMPYQLHLAFDRSFLRLLQNSKTHRARKRWPSRPQEPAFQPSVLTRPRCLSARYQDPHPGPEQSGPWSLRLAPSLTASLQLTPALAAGLEAGPRGHTAPLRPLLQPQLLQPDLARPAAQAGASPVTPVTRLTIGQGSRARLTAPPVCRGHQADCWRPRHGARCLPGMRPSQHGRAG